jgi:hypothetical protein
MNDIIAALPTLNKKELEAVIAVATQLAGVSNAPTSPLAGHTFDAIAWALGSPATLGIMPLALQKQLAKKLPALTLLFNSEFKGWNSTKNLQILFLRHMMILLRDDLIRLKLRPSPKLMIDHLSRMEEAFDNSFPFYRISGLGNWFVNKIKRETTRDKTQGQNRKDRKG